MKKFLYIIFLFSLLLPRPVQAAAAPATNNCCNFGYVYQEGNGKCILAVTNQSTLNSLCNLSAVGLFLPGIGTVMAAEDFIVCKIVQATIDRTAPLSVDTRCAQNSQACDTTTQTCQPVNIANTGTFEPAKCDPKMPYDIAGFCCSAQALGAMGVTAEAIATLPLGLVTPPATAVNIIAAAGGLQAIKNSCDGSGKHYCGNSVLKTYENGVCRNNYSSLMKFIENCGGNGQVGVATAIGCVPTGDLTKFLSFILKYVFFAAGGIILLMMIATGYTVVTSQGNPEKLQAARENIIALFSGLILIAFSLVLLQAIGADILGLSAFK